MNSENIYHQLALSVFNAMNSRDFSELERNVSDNGAFDFPGTGKIEGMKRVILFLKALLRKYPSLMFTVSEVLVDNHRACAVWTNKGASSSGQPYQNSGVTLLHFSDNRILFISDYFKDTSFVSAL